MREKGYTKNIIELYTDHNMTDLYVYTKYVSGNGATRQTFMDINYSHRHTKGQDRYPINIRDEFVDLNLSRFQVYKIMNGIRDYQVGEDCIYMEDDKWIKKDIKRDFKYTVEYDGYKCILLISPKKFKLHLENEKFKKEKFMGIKPAVYDITLYDKVSVNYSWKYNTVIVHKTNVIRNEEQSGSQNIYKKEFGEDRIEGIKNFYEVYEFYKHEALPDIIEFVV
jgi:hypothetical protein